MINVLRDVYGEVTPSCQLCTSKMVIAGHQSGRNKYQCPVCTKFEKFACSLCRQKFSLWSDYHTHQQACKPINPKYLPNNTTGRTKEQIIYSVEYFLLKANPMAIIGNSLPDVENVKEEEWEILGFKHYPGQTVR